VTRFPSSRVIAGVRLWRKELPKLSHEEIFALLAPPDPSRRGCRGTEETQGGSRAAGGRGRARSPAALYLAAAGVGTLGLVDFDVVDKTKPAASDPARHIHGRGFEARVRKGSDQTI